MTLHSVREQIAAAAAVVKGWPAWKQNILVHGSQSTNAKPWTPNTTVETTNRNTVMAFRSSVQAAKEAQEAYNAWCSGLPVQVKRTDIENGVWQDWSGGSADVPGFTSVFCEWRPKPKPEPSKPPRTPQQAMKEARVSGAVEAWENGLPIQVRVSYHTDDWEDFSGATPNFQGTQWVWRIKPPVAVHLNYYRYGTESLPAVGEELLGFDDGCWGYLEWYEGAENDFSYWAPQPLPPEHPGNPFHPQKDSQ